MHHMMVNAYLFAGYSEPPSHLGVGGCPPLVGAQPPAHHWAEIPPNSGFFPRRKLNT